MFKLLLFLIFFSSPVSSEPSNDSWECYNSLVKFCVKKSSLEYISDKDIKDRVEKQQQNTLNNFKPYVKEYEKEQDKWNKILFDVKNNKENTCNVKNNFKFVNFDSILKVNFLEDKKSIDYHFKLNPNGRIKKITRELDMNFKSIVNQNHGKEILAPMNKESSSQISKTLDYLNNSDLNIPSNKKDDFFIKFNKEIKEKIKMSSKMDSYVFDGKRKVYLVSQSLQAPQTDTVGNLYISKKWLDSEYLESILLHEAMHYCSEDYIPSMNINLIASEAFKLLQFGRFNSESKTSTGKGVFAIATKSINAMHKGFYKKQKDIYLNENTKNEYLKIKRGFIEISVDRVTIGHIKATEGDFNKYLKMLEELNTEIKTDSLNNRVKLVKILIEMYTLHPEISPAKFENMFGFVSPVDSSRNPISIYANKYKNIIAKIKERPNVKKLFF